MGVIVCSASVLRGTSNGAKRQKRKKPTKGTPVVGLLYRPFSRFNDHHLTGRLLRKSLVTPGSKPTKSIIRKTELTVRIVPCPSKCRFLSVAGEEISYVKTWNDPEYWLRKWPDFRRRTVESRSRRNSQPEKMKNSRCHGATNNQCKATDKLKR